MSNKFLIFFICLCFILACSNEQSNNSGDPDMYDASDMSLLMRKMVDYSKKAGTAINKRESLDTIPADFFNLLGKNATRNEQQDAEFQIMGAKYLKQLQGIQRGDSLAYYYTQSINACKSCHGVYCGGPMKIINKLDLGDL